MLKRFTLSTQVRSCDIRRGKPGNCEKCPIARRVLFEVAKRFRRWDNVTVEAYPDYIQVHYTDKTGESHHYSATTPGKGSVFMGEFDLLKRRRRGGRLEIDPKRAGAPEPVALELKFESAEY